MPKLLILFHSRTGSTARIADAVAEGARSVRFAEVVVRRVDDLVPESIVAADPAWSEGRARLSTRYRTLEHAESLADYDAIVLGSPARDGVLSAELKHVLDQTEPLWKSRVLINKVGSAFTSRASAQGRLESTVWSMLTPMAALGMILVPPGYPLPVALQESAAGSAAAAPPSTPDDFELAVARHQGRRVAEVVGWITHARSHHH